MINKEWLLTMLKTPSVSGNEYALQRKVKAYMDTYAETECDPCGNVYGRIHPEADVQILLSGHIDEIGLMISDVTSDGFLKVIKMGGIMPQQYLGQKVCIDHGGEVVYGAVGNSRSLHGKEVKCEDLWIDIGCTSKEEALRYVSIGDRVTFDTDVRMLKNDCITARAMDDRIGAFVVMEALRKAKEQGCQIGVIASSTVGEETNMRGAYAAAAKHHPTAAIAVDVTYTYDYPLTPSGMGDVHIQGGPVLCHSPLVNPRLNEQLVESAKRLGMQIQWEVAGGYTGTDADKMFYTDAGIPVALVSIPLRYMHSPDEVGSLRDIEACIDLLTECLVHYNTMDTLCPID